MTIREIRRRAQALGVRPGRLNKLGLVRAIQAAENNPQCFRTGRTTCDQTTCLWLEDCIPEQYVRQNQPAGIGARTGTWRR